MIAFIMRIIISCPNVWAEHLAGQKWIRNLNLNICKQVSKDEVNEYLNGGWEQGRLKQKKRKSITDITRLKQSIKRKEYWKSKKGKI